MPCATFVPLQTQRKYGSFRDTVPSCAAGKKLLPDEGFLAQIDRMDFIHKQRICHVIRRASCQLPPFAGGNAH